MDKEVSVTKLGKDNYVSWKWQFLNVLKAKNLTAIFTAENVDESVDGRAMALLRSTLTEENVLKIVDCRTFKQAWKTIEACYENKTAYEPQSLYRRLNSYKIESAKEVSTGLSEIRGIVLWCRAVTHRDI